MARAPLLLCWCAMAFAPLPAARARPLAERFAALAAGPDAPTDSMPRVDAPLLAREVAEALTLDARKARRVNARKGGGRGRSDTRGSGRAQRQALTAVLLHAVRLRRAACGDDDDASCDWEPSSLPRAYWRVLALTFAREGTPPLLFLHNATAAKEEEATPCRVTRDLDHVADSAGGLCARAVWHAGSGPDQCCPATLDSAASADILAGACDATTRCCQSVPTCATLCQATLLADVGRNSALVLPDLAAEHPHNWVSYLATRADDSADGDVTWAMDLGERVIAPAIAAADALVDVSEEEGEEEDNDDTNSTEQHNERKAEAFALHPFAYCALKCRSNTFATKHENAFRSVRHLTACFGESPYAHGDALTEFELDLRLKGLLGIPVDGS